LIAVGQDFRLGVSLVVEIHQIEASVLEGLFKEDVAPMLTSSAKRIEREMRRFMVQAWACFPIFVW
jgi:hypothetical protein